MITMDHVSPTERLFGKHVTVIVTINYTYVGAYGALRTPGGGVAEFG